MEEKPQADIVNELGDLDPEAIEQAYRARAADDFLLFTHGLYVSTPKGPTLFDLCMADFQRERFELLAPDLHAVKNGTKPPCGRLLFECSKGSSKSSDIGICLTWLTCFAAIPLKIQVAAADAGQADEIREAIDTLLKCNSWLEQYIEIQRDGVLNKKTGNKIEILRADIAGSHGARPNVLVIDELSHITKREFAENLMDNAAKVPHGLIIIATNAGDIGTWQEAWCNDFKRPGSRWTCHIWARPSPWITQEDLDDARRRNSRSRFLRLFYGVWSSGKGDALNPESIHRCFKRHLRPITSPLPGWQYIAGLDLGIKHDHAGFVILGVNRDEQLMRVAWLKGWAPNPRTKEVDLIDVENTLLAQHRIFNFAWVGYDPTQAKLMAQRLTRERVPMREVNFSVPKHLNEMAEALVQAVEGGKLEAYDDDEGRLRRDFGKFNIVERKYGYKLEAVADEHGHADVGTALAICLPRAISMMTMHGRFDPDEIIICEDTSPPTVEELEQMPKELKDIMDAVDDIHRDRVYSGTRRLSHFDDW